MTGALLVINALPSDVSEISGGVTGASVRVAAEESQFVTASEFAERTLFVSYALRRSFCHTLPLSCAINVGEKYPETFPVRYSVADAASSLTGGNASVWLSASIGNGTCAELISRS